MATTGKIFGVKIILNDHISPVTPSAAIGLYAITSDLSGNAASGQKDVAVDDGTIFAANEVVTVTDDNASETAIIVSIAGNTLTMQSNLTNSYTTAANALVNGNSVFRWSQNTVGGLSTWLGGFIVDKGIKAWTKTINLKRGGNIAQAGACQVTVNNTALFWNTLKSKSIYFNGLRCEIYEIQHTYSGGGANQVALVRRWAGICQKPIWSAKQYSIPLKGFHRKRIANITKQVNLKDYPNADSSLLSNSIPATFGEVKPRFDANNNLVYNGYFKFIRTANKETPFEVNHGSNNITDTINMFTNFAPSAFGRNFKHFPVVGDDGTTPPLKYNVQFAKQIDWYVSGVKQTSGTLNVTSAFVDKYIDIIEGAGDGKKRSITQAIVDIDSNDAAVLLTVDNYFEETLVGNATANAKNQTWVQLSNISRSYTIDRFPCKDCLDEDGNVITTGLNLFSFSQERTAKVTSENTDAIVEDKPLQFYRMPQFAYKDSGGGNKNQIDIVIKLFDDNPDQMNSFLLLPVTNVRLSTDTAAQAIEKWGAIATTFKIQDGFFSQIAYPTLASAALISGAIADITDKDKSSELIWRLTSQFGSLYIFILEFDLPIYPKRFIHDSVYIGSRFTLKPTNGNPLHESTEFFMRRFMGDPTKIIEKQSNPRTNGMILESVLDAYYSPVVDTNNKNFYFTTEYNETIDTVDYTIQPGYSSYELIGIDSEDSYNSITNMALIDSTNLTSAETADYITSELAIIFKKSISVKDAIYTPFRGRIFNDTWGGRFTSANLIESPRNLAEHFDRLQNWEDTSSPPTDGWGKNYAPGALIKTGATTIEGSYDYAGPEFTILDTYRASSQIQDYNKCYTDVLKTSICKDFFTASYYDQDGYANFKRILKSSTSPADSVTLADIVDRSKIIITDPQPADIFPEPFVRYRKNFATSKYESIIRVTNADAESYSSDYVEGLSDSSAEELWNRCNTLFKKARHLEKPPADMTDKTWFNGSDADSLAQDYIFNWVDWMFNPMIRFPVHYNKAGSWNEAQRFTLQLPHQTNDVVIECLLTGLKVDPNPPYHVIVTAIMFSETIPENFNFKDTFTSVSLQWKDQDSVLGDANDKKDNT